jgi:hypothetical protein
MPVAIPISDVPIAPVAVSFASGPAAAELPARRARNRPEHASPARRLAGWTIDLTLLGMLFSAHVVLAARLAETPRPGLGLVLAAPWLWAGLGAGLALAWSWLFVALWCRTPGMALTGQRLRLVQGGVPTPLAAFARALLAVLCAAPGFFGFALALFDARGQTLHDKLCGCVVIVD